MNTTIEGIKTDTPNENRVLLEETFYVLTKKNCVFSVKLLKKGLSLIKESDSHSKEQLIPIKDIIGCRCLRSKKQSRGCSCQSLPRSGSLKVVEENSVELDDNDVSAYLYIYAYLLQRPKGVPNRRERTIITLRFRSFDKFEDNHKEAQRWRTTIKKLINGEQVSYSQIIDFSLSHKFKEAKKLLVLCNPKSGAGRGKSIFQDKIAPVLQEAEIPFDLHITKYANFAREFVRNANLFQWSAVLVVGGDGIVFEAINGIFERWDWSRIMKTIPLGVVPGGSGNGLARSIAYHCGEPYIPSTLPSALSSVKNKTVPMDLVRVETKSKIMFSFLSVGWGFISDVDIESERLRILGGQRFSVWSLARLIGLRSYAGKIYYLPINRKSHSLPTLDIQKDVELSPISINFEQSAQRQRRDSWYSANSKRTEYFSTSESACYKSLNDEEQVESSNKDEKVRIYGPASQIPCLNAVLPPSWECIEGRFLMVHASYQSHLSEDCLFVPDAKLNDGIIWLLIIPAATTRSQLFHFLLGMSSGSHLNFVNKQTGIQFLQVQSFRIEPDANEQGYMTVDGELVDYGPIQAEIFPELGRIMVP